MIHMHSNTHTRQIKRPTFLLLFIHLLCIQEEDERLRLAVETLNMKNWSAIAAFVGTRKKPQCYQRWHRVLNPDISKGRFSQNEIILLAHSIRMYGKGKWGRVIQGLSNRTDVQCRSRWIAVEKSMDPFMQDLVLYSNGEKEYAELGKSWNVEPLEAIMSSCKKPEDGMDRNGSHDGKWSFEEEKK
eukprot:TRINITY_DN738_c0_g1_i2.p1 TRINITY_DN738_c0_g1~~TRINITY_DN738_c0_g1_i2.p1  ORF type:complete len:186 (-),score=39.52 TRINITY_DN738_c0_g1_i2:358-915(-)